MATEKEWIRQAEKLEQESRDALEHGDERWAEVCEIKARACRNNSVYGTAEDDFKM